MEKKVIPLNSDGRPRWGKGSAMDDASPRRANARVFFNKKDRRIAALQMYYDRMRGATYAELEKNYKVSSVTVRRLLDLAVDDELVKKIENKILADVVPMAIEVYKKKLAEDSEFVAKDVLATFAKIADRNIKREEVSNKNKEDEDSLEFLLRIKGKKALTSARSANEEEIIDAETVNTSVNGLLGAAENQDSLEIAGLQGHITEAIRADIRPVDQAPEARAQEAGSNGGEARSSSRSPAARLPSLVRAHRNSNPNSNSTKSTNGFTSVGDLISEALEDERKKSTWKRRERD